ncbi:MAG: glycoside hydrolase domain-containing protein [Pseudonocardiaceae bacterium]
MLGLDYAGGRPGGAAIASAGYGFVCRYLSDGGTRLPGKLLTPPEYADLLRHRVAVVVNWETSAGRMKAGRAAGIKDAGDAAATAAGVGHPVDRPIYFSADFDATPGDQVAINDYLAGAASVIGPSRVGVYGSYYVCQRCLDRRTATWAWQTGAWSGGQREPRARIYQRIGTVTVGGVPCDVNEALASDFGQYPRPITHQEDTVPWELTRTPVKQGSALGDAPDGSWPVIEDTITLPGPTGGWRGRILAWPVFGYGGGYIQEAWWGVSDAVSRPAAVHVVDPAAGAVFNSFWPTGWEAPANARFLVLRYAAPNGGSVGIETEH